MEFICKLTKDDIEQYIKEKFEEKFRSDVVKMDLTIVPEYQDGPYYQRATIYYDVTFKNSKAVGLEGGQV